MNSYQYLNTLKELRDKIEDSLQLALKLENEELIDKIENIFYEMILGDIEDIENEQNEEEEE